MKVTAESRRDWLIAAAAIMGAVGLLICGRGQASSPGSQVPISITVVPADATNLDCSSDARFGPVRCNFDASGRQDPVDQPLRPYVTTGRELYLLSGVFEQPEVNQWLQRARATGNSARVTVDCEATMLGQLGSVPVRWQTGAAFAPEQNVPVARVSNCRITR